MSMNEFMMVVMKAVISIAVAAIGIYLVPWIKAKVSSEKTDEVMAYVTEFVQVAEQIYGEKTGKTKKEFVMGLVEGICKKIGVKISDEQIDALVESAVYDMNLYLKNTEKEEKEGTDGTEVISE